MSNDQIPKWQQEKDAELCAEISGFLFKHPCGMFARYRCQRCEKPTCLAHSITQGEHTICESCAELPTGQPTSTPKRHWLETDFWDDIDVDNHNRPMWYRRKGGVRSSRASDIAAADQIQRQLEADTGFTDADEIGFSDQNQGTSSFAEDPTGWENDMGAS